MNTARILIDFGLVVLIWLVQLIIYPGFKYSATETFTAWHARYSTLISIVVVPLMMGQVIVIACQFYFAPHWSVWIAAGLVALAWFSTFFQAVPLHKALGAGTDLKTNIERLVDVNWNRTVLWTLSFIMGLTHYVTFAS